MEIDARCPYCGEPITLVVDEGGGSDQRYVEDCEVCCRPMDVRARMDDDLARWTVEVERVD